MKFTEQIARVTHEANRAYCVALGDHSQPSWDDAPEWQRESAIMGIEAIRDGSAKTPEEQHQSWLDEKARTGWVYGPEKDPVAKTHHCIVPYHELPPEQQMKDHLFRAVATALLNGPTHTQAPTLASVVPGSIESEPQRALYQHANALRGEIKGVAGAVNRQRQYAAVLVHTESLSGEVPANLTLAYRHLEDASMRLGKTMQALDGGVSVYDRSTTVGA